MYMYMIHVHVHDVINSPGYSYCTIYSIESSFLCSGPETSIFDCVKISVWNNLRHLIDHVHTYMYMYVCTRILLRHFPAVL